MTQIYEHTPGPWDAKDWRVCHSIGGDIGVICDTASNAKTRTLENRANARLISAAPELLEACEAMLDGYEAGKQIRELCRVAIAKAKGSEA